jgi:tagaturonate reductase
LLISYLIAMSLFINRASASQFYSDVNLERLTSLPEKVLQFGTGVLLRGLPGYFIDKANKNGIFNGRIVVVKSTSHGSVDAFHAQDNLYTHCIRGVENGQSVHENILNTSISRVLNANTQWKDILACAHDPEMKIIISNTTEIGIQLLEENILQTIPISFPGKLLAFLYERFHAFNGDEHSGMVIIPTELITNNGEQLRNILTDLARFNQLDDAFIDWLQQHNSFCNSLVDRIVPGKPSGNVVADLEHELGYTDELLIVSESYRLWAIEGDDRIQNILSFSQSDPQVIITSDIQKYRELKLRLLNGTHTLSCGIAVLLNIDMVKDAMQHPLMKNYIGRLMYEEIATSIPYKIESNEIRDFASQVLDRFRNPAIEHLWMNIMVQYTSKLKLRIIPVLHQYIEQNKAVPPFIALGFAAYLHITRKYELQDQHAEAIRKIWEDNDLISSIRMILSDKSLWGPDLTSINGWYEIVMDQFMTIHENGMQTALERIVHNQPVQ